MDKIPTDDEVLEALGTSEDGLTPSALIQMLEDAGHTHDNIIRAIQRVFERNKVSLSEDTKLVPTAIGEPALV